MFSGTIYKFIHIDQKILNMQSEDIGYGPNCATWGFPIEAIKAESDADLQKIYTSLECPVCHQFPKTGQNIYSCKLNRHMICEACLPESRICPACQDTISSEKSFAVETCISNFIIPCKYKFEGCHEIIRVFKILKILFTYYEDL